MTATIRTTYRPAERYPWLAEIAENPEMHAVGLTEYEAVGRLVVGHGQGVGIQIIHPPEHDRKNWDDVAPDDDLEHSLARLADDCPEIDLDRAREAAALGSINAK